MELVESQVFAGADRRRRAMIFTEMSRKACLQVLAGTKLARLACAFENQPYIVPTYLAYHEASEMLYGFTTFGQKVKWMRTNPSVCVEVDEVAACDQWVSVIATGRYEELPGTPESIGTRLQAPDRPRNATEAISMTGDSHQTGAGERHEAWQALKTLPMWWQPGSEVWATRADRDAVERLDPIYYRIRIDSITGHEATRETEHSSSHVTPAPTTKFMKWLRRAMSR